MKISEETDWESGKPDFEYIWRYSVYRLSPKVVGWWVLPGGQNSAQIKFSVFVKPNWLHRKMMLWLMGWKYEEASKENT